MSETTSSTPDKEFKSTRPAEATPLFTDPDIAHMVALKQQRSTENSMAYRKLAQEAESDSDKDYYNYEADKVDAKLELGTAIFKEKHDQILASRQEVAEALGQQVDLGVGYMNPDAATRAKIVTQRQSDAEWKDIHAADDEAREKWRNRAMNETSGIDKKVA